MSHHLRTSMVASLQAALLAACSHGPAVMRTSNQPPGLTVVGKGEARGEPDIARVTLGVEVRAADARRATAQGAKQMNAVVDALKQAGVAAADIQTSNLSLHYERPPSRPPEPAPASTGPEGEVAPAPKPKGHYRLSNVVRVVVRDLDRAAAVIDAAMKAGANQVRGIHFDLEDRDALIAEARRAAVADAKENAQQLADLMGVALGRLVAIHEGRGQPVPHGASLVRAEMLGSSTPVERGELTVEHTVELIYELP